MVRAARGARRGRGQFPDLRHGYFHDAEVKEVLGVPADGYPLGRWGVAPRVPAHEVAFRNSWGASVGFEIDEPLWQLPVSGLE